jgi:hypothetical protein
MPSTGRRKQLCEDRFPLLYRCPAQIVTVEREQVEGAKDHVVTTPAQQQIKHRKDAVAVVLDLVNPAGPRRRLFRGSGEARLDALQLALQLTRRGHVPKIGAVTAESSHFKAA